MKRDPYEHLTDASRTSRDTHSPILLARPFWKEQQPWVNSINSKWMKLFVSRMDPRRATINHS